jgi:hypothetical protein
MRTGARASMSRVMPPSTARMSPNMAPARRKASRRLPSSSSSVKTGMNAAESAASANSERMRFGTRKAKLNADRAPKVP